MKFHNFLYCVSQFQINTLIMIFRKGALEEPWSWCCLHLPDNFHPPCKHTSQSHGDDDGWSHLDWHCWIPVLMECSYRYCLMHQHCHLCWPVCWLQCAHWSCLHCCTWWYHISSVKIWIITFAGNRMEKTLRSIETIGPAVFNGGLTTFLALTLCGGSTSHTFITFFKVRSYLH